MLEETQKSINTRRKPKKKQAWGRCCAAAAIVIYVSAFCICFGFEHISGNGMEPSINDGATVAINKLAYLYKSPLRGDIVAYGGQIGRIIGLPGDTVSITGGKLLINGQECTESYIQGNGFIYADMDEVLLSGDEYLVMPDNRGEEVSYGDGSVAAWIVDNPYGETITKKELDGKIIVIL